MLCYCCQEACRGAEGDMRVMLPGMLPYRARSSCRLMSRTSACCGRQPTSTWPKIPATASLFMKCCSACNRCITLYAATPSFYFSLAFTIACNMRIHASLHNMLEHLNSVLNSLSVYLCNQGFVIHQPALLFLQSRVWLHALQPGPSPFHCH